MYSLLHDIPWFLILFLEELLLIFNQMLSIWAFGRRDTEKFNNPMALFLLKIRDTENSDDVPGPQIRMRNWKLFFLFLSQNICCGYSKEPSWWAN